MSSAGSDRGAGEQRIVEASSQRDGALQRSVNGAEAAAERFDPTDRVRHALLPAASDAGSAPDAEPSPAAGEM